MKSIPYILFIVLAFCPATHAKSSFLRSLDEGKALIASSNWAAASEYFDNLRRKYPKSPDVIACVAVIRAEYRELHEAKQLFEEGLKYQPGHENCLIGLGYCEIKLGNNEAALRVLLRATRAFPNNPYAFLGVAYAAFNLQKTELAEDYMQRATKLLPRNRSPKQMK